ncbi:MAG: RDD family protein [Deltaproteobacteria bacterium]|nr:RDD family protein [Deltaproteobacteria bacterium]
MNELDALEIIGPEGVPLRFPRAPIVDRAMAFSIDLCLLFLLASISAAILVLAGLGSGLLSVAGLGLIFFFVVRHGYFLFFETHWQGATPGKRLLGLKVISRDGGGLSLDAIIARNLMRDMELFIPLVALGNPAQFFGRAPAWLLLPASLWLLVMMLMPILSRERTRLGDLVGGTLVVRVPKAPLLVDEAGRDSLIPAAPGHAAPEFESPQLEIYGEHELETLAELLRKAEQGNASREDLTLVALAIARKVGFFGDAPTREPARFLRRFYRAQRAHLEGKLLMGKRKGSKFDAS